jgi:hypothetical protein
MSNTPGGALSRVRASQGQKHSCSRCGSEHFYEVQVSQYKTGGYGTVEISQDTDAQTHPLLKCAGCDFPILPKSAVGRKSGGIMESSTNDFRASVMKGQELIKSMDPKVIENKVVLVAAGKAVEQDVLALAERVKALETVPKQSNRSTKPADEPATS